METTRLMKGIFIFVVFMMSIAVNAEDNVLARLGLDGNYLLMGLVAMVLTGLVMHRDLMLIVLVLLLSIGANLPADLMHNFGVDRDYFVGALGAIVLIPIISKIAS